MTGLRLVAVARSSAPVITTKAKAVDGGPVTAKSTGEVIPHFKWVNTGELMAVDGRGRANNKIKVPEGTKAGGKVYCFRLRRKK